MGDDLGIEVTKLPPLTWIDEETCYFSNPTQVVAYHPKTGEKELLASLPKSAKHLESAPNFNQAYTSGYNLWVGNHADGIKQITNDGNREIQYGIAAHRSEFGIRKGLFWSPTGNKLAFYRVDQQMVTDYPLVDFSAYPAKYTPNKYPMAGGKSHHATVGVYDVSKGQVIYLQTDGPKEQYLTNITWSPDEQTIYVAIVNRAQNHMWLNAYDANTGTLQKTLFEEKHDKYVEPEHGPIFLEKKPDHFLWYSERDGFDHLYLYKTDGTLVRQVTKGKWKVTEVLGLDAKEKHVFIMSTKESPMERHAYKVSLKNGEMKKLTSQPGFHESKLSPDGNYLYDAYSSLEVPRAYQLIETQNGETVRTIYSSPNPLKKYKLGEISLLTLQADDGTDLYCRMIKPINFDPKKQYPVMVYVYNGPHVQLVQNKWLGAARPFLQYMAQQGFVVFTVDGRGSSNRGLEFEQAVFRQLGTLEVQDQLTGLKHLKSLPYVDQERLGIFGWSYGGFMTTSLMLRAPGAFDVGVAGGPVIDWKFYEIMYAERYMDTPEENPEGYAASNLVNYVNDLKGELLIIHGLQDSTVVPQHSNALIRKSVEEGVMIDYFPYPSHPHNVRGTERAHLLKKVSKYFVDRLGTPKQKTKIMEAQQD
ncbi:UNVERIFIED_CONTAM: hypothetical protein GTU68_017640 [Idotea baltica]|nr:hypothetical protein [Idotea baltica]